jgi:hypothetical protein
MEEMMNRPNLNAIKKSATGLEQMSPVLRKRNRPVESVQQGDNEPSREKVVDSLREAVSQHPDFGDFLEVKATATGGSNDK